MQKRANYFDLGRDDFMALEEYLLSGLSDKDLGRAEGGLASLPGYAPGGPVGFTGAKSWPSIRADAKAFDQILEIANFKDKSAFHRALKRAGIDNADLAGKKNFINQRIRNIWKKKGLLLKNAPTYENIMTHGGKFNLEQAMGITPGTPGAPGNAKIWEEGKKLENQALKKFKNKGDRIKHIVDGMYKKFGRFEGVTKTLIKSAITRYPGFLMKILGPVSGLGYATDILGLTDVMDFNKDKIEPGEKIAPEIERFKGGGMADIYDMTQPLGYDNGGEVETIPSKHQFSSKDSNIIKNMLKSEMLRQNSPDINTDKIAYQFMAEMNYKPTERNLKGIQDAITMEIFNAQDELKQENTSDLGKLAGTARDKYQTFMESDDKMRLIGNKLGLGSLWQ